MDGQNGTNESNADGIGHTPEGGRPGRQSAMPASEGPEPNGLSRQDGADDNRDAPPSSGEVNPDRSESAPAAAPATGGSDAGGRQLDRKLLEFLVCPLTRTTLIYDRERHELVSAATGYAFPISDGVPLLTEECARVLDEDDRRRLRIK